MRASLRGVLTASLIFVSAAGWARSEKETATAYNEAADDSGALRESYQDFARATGVRPYPVSPTAVANLMAMPMNDKIKILPIPAVLSDQDYGLLQRGAQQRARALKAFFADVILHGAKRALDAKLITPDQLAALPKVESSALNLDFLRTLWERRSEKDIGFIFGPDVVRDASGNFKVLEDNVGPIGGLGDLAASHNAYYSSFGPSPELEAPVKGVIEKFLSDIPRERWAEDVIVLYREDGSSESKNIRPEDDEDKRMARAISELGLKTMTYSRIKQPGADLDVLLSGKYKKIVNFISPFSMPMDYSALQSFLLAFRDGKFDLLTAPGVEFLGTKALLPLVDPIIRLYLNEEPILSTQETHWILSPADIDAITDGWVIKQTDGSQGSEVYIYNYLTEEGRTNLKSMLREWQSWSSVVHNQPWPKFVKQKLMEPSYLPAEFPNSWMKFNVDYRPHVFVVAGEPVTPAVWGRASWKIPGVLNNVSQSAMEMVVTTPSQCERALMKFKGAPGI